MFILNSSHTFICYRNLCRQNTVPCDDALKSPVYEDIQELQVKTAHPYEKPPLSAPLNMAAEYEFTQCPAYAAVDKIKE